MELTLRPDFLDPARPAARKYGCIASGLGLAAHAFVLVTGLAAPVVASPHEGIKDYSGQVAPLRSDANGAQSDALPPPLGPELAQFDSHLFFEDRQALLGALHDLQDGLNSDIRPSHAEIDLLLDLAALHLSQRLLPEAQSFLSGVPNAIGASGLGRMLVTAEQTRRRAALEAAVHGFGAAVATTLDGWADAPLFDALHLIARDEYAAARPFLASAVMILEGYPPALSDAAFLQIFSAAIESAAWDVARAVAVLLDRGDAGTQSAGYRYLLGRAAVAGGDLVAAFDNYAAAAEGRDAWAQHARLALIDLGRRANALTPQDARQLLTQTRNLWTGGALGLTTLQRLSALELAERRDLPALAVLADILRLHPSAPEAELAAVQADALIDEIYTRGFVGDMPLADFVTAHRAIERDFRTRPRFDAFAEQFADHLAAHGASGLAAAEFGAIRERMNTRALALTNDPLTQAAEITAMLQSRDRLRLKHAEALMQGGRLADAEALLEIVNAAPDAVLRDRYNLMRARLFAATQRPAEVLRTRMTTPSDDYLRLRAEAAFALGAWADAQETYETLLRRLGPDMRARDRINLLLAAHRSGDADRVRDLTRNFPDLERHMAALAQGLSTDAPDVLPLRDDAARQRIENADIALRQLQAAGGGGIP